MHPLRQLNLDSHKDRTTNPIKDKFRIRCVLFSQFALQRGLNPGGWDRRKNQSTVHDINKRKHCLVLVVVVSVHFMTAFGGIPSDNVLTMKIRRPVWIPISSYLGGRSSMRSSLFALPLRIRIISAKSAISHLFR